MATLGESPCYLVFWSKAMPSIMKNYMPLKNHQCATWETWKAQPRDRNRHVAELPITSRVLSVSSRQKSGRDQQRSTIRWRSVHPESGTHRSSRPEQAAGAGGPPLSHQHPPSADDQGWKDESRGKSPSLVCK